MNRRRRAANRDSHAGGRGDGRGGAEQPVDVRAWWGIGVPAAEGGEQGEGGGRATTVRPS